MSHVKFILHVQFHTFFPAAFYRRQYCHGIRRVIAVVFHVPIRVFCRRLFRSPGGGGKTAREQIKRY
ncbi:hypothetical protein KCP78_24510 [Salmonella enterica subsp. enterica]|nr:hypothetical protein KCP78_24510 [Salmonella enterica subsp. enterica]